MMISVVIPLYNKENTIKYTIESVLSQQYKDFELIVVNDGSTDNSLEIVTQLSLIDSRIKVYDRKNEGVSAARNFGVEHAQSNWVAFLDADDLWHELYLSKVSEMIQNCPDAGMFCMGGIVENNCQKVVRIDRRYFNRIAYIDYFQSPYVYSHTSATTISKKIFAKTIGFPIGMKRSQDLSLFFSMALLAPVSYAGFLYSKYVGDVEGQTTSLKKNIIPYMIYLVNKFSDDLYKNNNKTAESFFLYDLRHRIKTYIKTNIDDLRMFSNGLSLSTLRRLPSFERYLLKKEMFIVYLLYINITKIHWIMKGYPMVRNNKPKKNDIIW